MNSVVSTSRTSQFAGAKVTPRFSQNRAPLRLAAVSPKAEEGGWDFFKLAGGRSGLAGGEKALKTEEGRKMLFAEEAKQKAAKSKSLREIENFAAGEDDIYVGSGRYMKGDAKKLPDKEDIGPFKGATGGFAGGEEVLWGFRDAIKVQMEEDRKLNVAASMVTKIDPKKAMMATPLLMPGMNALVTAERSPYHMFTGIVQRVSDGKAQVLFEGGNWDKSVTFLLEDLERSKAGPPGENPKSAILTAKIEELKALAEAAEAASA